MVIGSQLFLCELREVVMQRSKIHAFVRSSMFIAALATTTASAIPNRLSAQQEDYARLEVAVKSDKEVAELAKERNKAKNAKAEKIDMAPIEKYYKDYLIPRLTQPNPEVINASRQEFLGDINGIQAGPAAAMRTYNDRVIALLREVILSKDKRFAPETRINAIIIMCKLASSMTKDRQPISEPLIQPTLLSLIDPKEVDALSWIALSTVNKHLSERLVNENSRKQFFSAIKGFLEAPQPHRRSNDVHKYFTGLAIECLTKIAATEPEKEPAKEVTEYLGKLLVKLFDTEESEWLLESACVGLGFVSPTTLTEEEVSKLEIGLTKFARTSLKDWKKRISMSSGAMGGGYGAMGGYGGMEGGSMPGGSNSPGYGGGAGTETGSGYGMGGMGGKNEQKKQNPFEHQPKEVKNARRIAHQRFERIHLALNGSYRKPEKSADPAAAAPPEPKGLVKLMGSNPRKDNILKLIEKIEDFQLSLNDEKIADLSSMTTLVGKAMKGLREVCVEIMGEDNTTFAKTEAEKGLFGNQ